MVGPLALSLPLSAKLAVRMPTVKANMNAAAATIMPLVIMEAPKLLGHSASIAVYSTVACDARHRFGEYVVEHAEHVSIVIAKNYSGGASLAREATRANAKVPPPCSNRAVAGLIFDGELF
jgi:hypothetical protein